VACTASAFPRHFSQAGFLLLARLACRCFTVIFASSLRCSPSLFLRYASAKMQCLLPPAQQSGLLCVIPPLQSPSSGIPWLKRPQRLRPPTLLSSSCHHSFTQVGATCRDNNVSHWSLHTIGNNGHYNKYQVNNNNTTVNTVVSFNTINLYFRILKCQ